MPCNKITPVSGFHKLHFAIDFMIICLNGKEEELMSRENSPLTTLNAPQC
jgi:hypothetical protein